MLANLVIVRRECNHDSQQWCCAAAQYRVSNSADQRRIGKMSEQEKRRLNTSRIFSKEAKGRRPQTDQELKEWLATPDGKAATVFEPTSLSCWREVGRS
jgi:hypothetical protein